MTYQMSIVGGPPRYDSLPVAKITCYPLEKRDYKPYAQCIFCGGQGLLTLRMWAFEVSPMPESALEAVFYLFRQDLDLALRVRLDNAQKITVLLRKGGEEQVLEVPALTYKPHNGEDLQGVYWGGTIQIPVAPLEMAGGPLSLMSGERFGGNFYKLCLQKPFVHKGCWYPADFEGDPYGWDSMGEFLVVAHS